MVPGAVKQVGSSVAGEAIEPAMTESGVVSLDSLASSLVPFPA